MQKTELHESFSDLLIEGFGRKNAPEFQKVIPEIGGEGHLFMYKILQTLSNFHDSVADLYAQQGDKSKATYHYSMANRMRLEAQQDKVKYGNHAS